MKGSSARLVENPPELSVAPVYVDKHDRLRSRQNSVERVWLLWERRRFLMRAAVCGLIASTIIAFIIPTRYESTTRLMPPDTQSGSGMAILAALTGKGGLGLSSMAGDLLGMKSSGALFTDILRSRTVENRLIDRFDLRKVYHDRYWEEARKDLMERTAFYEDRKSGVITITVWDRDPHRAAQLAQAYVEELDRLVAEVSTSSARRERVFIEQRLQTVKQDLDNASRKFSEYASQNTAIDITAQGKATVEAAAKLEGELIVAQSQLQGLEQIYSKDSVRIRSLQATVNELRSQLHMIGGEKSDLSSDQNAASKNSSSQEFPSIRQLPLLGVKWADLYRETKIQETVYELLTQQYELAKIQEAKEIPVVKMLDAADVPEKKSYPPRVLVILLSACAFVVIAMAWIVAGSEWKQVSAIDPRKVLVQTVWQAVASPTRRLLSRLPVNGNRVSSPRESATHDA
jgi:capsule polysaccharide export protein KpsE/RkpR